MLSEDKVNVSERQFVLEGAVSPATLGALRAGLPKAWAATTRCFFARFAYADLPLGKRFNFAFPKNQPGDAEETVAIVVAVTQQWAKPFESIPHGWGTVCLIDFPQGIPNSVSRMPTVSGWYESKVAVVLCSLETRDALISKA